MIAAAVFSVSETRMETFGMQLLCNSSSHLDIASNRLGSVRSNTRTALTAFRKEA
jgi:hypothetical protein